MATKGKSSDRQHTFQQKSKQQQNSEDEASSDHSDGKRRISERAAALQRERVRRFFWDTSTTVPTNYLNDEMKAYRKKYLQDAFESNPNLHKSRTIGIAIHLRMTEAAVEALFRYKRDKAGTTATEHQGRKEKSEKRWETSTEGISINEKNLRHLVQNARDKVTSIMANIKVLDTQWFSYQI